MSYELKTNDPAIMEGTESTLGLVSLEPRILLDAAGFVTGAEVAMDSMVSEGAQQGVDAIFGEGDDPTAAPVNGPWLNDPTAAPVNGPWLGNVTLEADGDNPTAAPVNGPWL